ncbi:MAG: hypothetical protein D6767_05715 [Candidatus Hydrogenedentota bacterium]|nr:MAG: hypothetical protein D6767_05715 [Candidatus Hydrogenedentota bacterium]
MRKIFWLALFVFFTACKKTQIDLPHGVVEASKIPSWWEDLQLIPPESVVLQEKGKERYVIKAAWDVKVLESIYQERMKKNHFRLLGIKKQEGNVLLQFSRTSKGIRTVVSIVLEPFLQGDNSLIRIGKSEVNYSVVENGE